MAGTGLFLRSIVQFIRQWASPERTISRRPVGGNFGGEGEYPQEPLGNPTLLTAKSIDSDSCAGLLREYAVTLSEVPEDTAEDCPICLASVAGRCATTHCGHRFHADCLSRHFSAPERPATCPLCRAPSRTVLPVVARAASGRPIEVFNRVPSPGGRCHFDRPYQFTSLGEFACRPRMLYVMTSNGDKWTPACEVMWTLELSVPATVHLNFRSGRHVEDTGASAWLRRGGWTSSKLQGTVSTGIPHGPYSGPVYCKTCSPGIVRLMGSNCQEGAYFVFVELRGPDGAD